MLKYDKRYIMPAALVAHAAAAAAADCASDFVLNSLLSKDPNQYPKFIEVRFMLNIIPRWRGRRKI